MFLCKNAFPLAGDWLPSLVSNILTWHGGASAGAVLGGAAQELQSRQCWVPAPAGIQGTRNHRACWKCCCWGKRSPMAAHSFVTAPLSRALDGDKGGVATEQKISKLGITGQILKLEGKVLESKWLCPCPRPRGGDACSRVRGTGSDEIMPCWSWWQCPCPLRQAQPPC